MADDEALAILRRAGETDDYRALEELEGFLSLSIAAALDSPNPLIRGVAVLDGRVGKRRLLELRKRVEHPLVRDLLELRCAAEGLGTGVRAV